MNKINNNTKDWRMTVEELRKLEGFQNISKEEAEEVVDFLFQLARIEIDVYLNNSEE